jgi:tetratricopeptide (TPR) repeat protein
LKNDPGNVLVYQGTGLALYRLQRLDDAEKEFQLALKADGKLWLSHNFLGVIYDRKRYRDPVQWRPWKPVLPELFSSFHWPVRAHAQELVRKRQKSPSPEK